MPRGRNSHIVVTYVSKENFNFMLLKFKRGFPMWMMVYQKMMLSLSLYHPEWKKRRGKYMCMCCSCRYDCLHKKILIFFLSVSKINKSFLSHTLFHYWWIFLVYLFIIHPNPFILTYSLVHHHFHPLVMYIWIILGYTSFAIFCQGMNYF